MKRPKSKDAGKQRKFALTAPLHIRRKFMAAHLSKELKKEYKKRSLKLRKGDEVVVMRGGFKKRGGKVSRVNTEKMRVYIEGLMIRRTDGTERQVGIHPSNLKIIKLNLEDKRRFKTRKEEKEAQKPVKENK